MLSLFIVKIHGRAPQHFTTKIKHAAQIFRQITCHFKTYKTKMYKKFKQKQIKNVLFFFF